jgi:DNA ligase (NAD+)
MNTIIKNLNEDLENTLDNLKETQLKKVIDHLRKEYFNKNENLVEDHVYDYIKEYYEDKFDKVISEVGHKIEKNKVKLPYYMGSLDKIKPSTSVFNKWIDKYPGPYICTYKLDGISALLCKKNNKFYMYTRGNGKEGQDISYCIDLIGINTTNLCEGDAIRGELIISKKNFQKIKNIMSNARNAVSGFINTKTPDPNMLKLIDFAAYWTVSPELKSSEQLKYIESKKFTPKVVKYQIFNKLTIDKLSELLINGRKIYEYEIDGVVVIDNSKTYKQEVDKNPSYGFAFKQILTDQIAESTVVDVIWEISKDKYIKPKIKINPIEILGSEITYATAFNAKYIVDNNLGPGAIVKIIKSGDVIPYIQEIIKPASTNKPKMPNIKYDWNDTKVDIIAIELDDENLKKIITKKLTYFFTTLDIKFMAEGTIEKFVDNGYDDLYKILKANKKKLQEIDGIGEKLIDKLYDSINNGLQNRKLSEIMAASQILGRGIGKRKFKIITDKYPDIIQIYNKKDNKHVKNLINELNGFDDITTDKIVDNFDEFINYLNKLLKIKPNLLQSNNSNSDKKNKAKTNKSNSNFNLKKYANKTLVFTGFRDKVIEEELDKIGSKVTTSVSKNTDILIAADINEKSSKITKAKDLEIELLSKEQFYDSIKK